MGTSMWGEAGEFLRHRRKMNLMMVIVNVAVFLVLSVLGETEDGQFMLRFGAAWTPFILEKGQYWRLVTSMFLHFGIVHLIYNMLCLIYMGDLLERFLGPWRYLIIYLLGGIGGNIASLLWDVHTGSNAVSAGASGAIFAVIGALCVIAWKGKGRIRELPLKRLGIMTVLMLAQGFTEVATDNAAHVGGMLTGLVLGFLFVSCYTPA